MGDPVWICLLRGVNVGGVILRMEDFRSLLSGLGYGEVRTFIQSGNALFTAGAPVPEDPSASAVALGAEIGRALTALLGRDIPALVLSRAELGACLACQPFDPGLGGDRIYLTLASGPIDAGRFAALVSSLPGPEDFRLAGAEAGSLAGRLVYGAFPSGYGKTKYSNNYLEKYFAVPATTRNLNTMQKLLALAEGREGEA